MRFFQKTKGAISIFLVIILVPMLCVSSLFVDASRIKLGNAMAQSAGDLTLNTALTNYDTQLKELYGLLATAQNTDDLFLKLEEYYRACLVSAGLDDADADIYLAQLMGSLQSVSESQNVSDIMSMEVVDFTVEKYSNADLANAAILKKQIVDFMKYRAPINTGLSFVSSLKSFSTLSKQSELVEKKQNYYEKQQDVLEALNAAWAHILAYNNSKIVSDANYLPGIKDTMDGFAGNFKDYGKRTIKALYQKKGPIIDDPFAVVVVQQEVTKYNINGEESEETENQWIITYNNRTNKSYLHSGYSCGYTYNYKAKVFPTAAQVRSALQGYNNALNALNNAQWPVAPANADPIQFVAQNKSDAESYTTALVSYYNAYHKLKHMWHWLDGYDLVEVKTDDGKYIITKEDILSEKLTIGKTEKTLLEWYNSWSVDGTYEARMTDYSGKASVFLGFVNQAITDYNTQWNINENQTIDDAIKEKQVIAKGYVDTLTIAIDHLDKAIVSLGVAKEKLTTANSAKSDWSEIAEDGAIKDTSLAKQDQAEIDQLDNYLNATNIDKLVTRLTNIKNDLTSVKLEVEKYKYADKFIGNITGYSTLESALGSKYSNLKQMPVEKGQLETDSTQKASDAWSAGAPKTDWTTQSQHQPDLLQEKLSLYTYMSAHFAKTPAADKNPTEEKSESEENGKEFYQDIKDTAKETADNESKNADSGAASKKGKGDIAKGEFGELPSKIPDREPSGSTPSGKVDTKVDKDEGGKGAAGKSASVLNSLFGKDILKDIADMGEGLRDRLFISDYIMSMFSYDTIENEYLKEHKDVQEITDGMLLTLTKNDISPTRNYAYGAEVEYIIYGGTNESNLTKAYGTIYGIRFGFNLVYAFATSEIRESALAIATPISAATLGIIPVPLIQAVIIIGIACCESAVDLANLKAGEKVPLYKSRETWCCSVTGLTKAAKNIASEIVKDAAEDVVNEGVNKLNGWLDMTNEELDKVIDEESGKIQEAVGQAYDQIITENADAAVQQLTTLINTAVESTFCLDGTETYESKKAAMIDWVKNRLTEWGNQFSGDDIASMVKRKAAEIIVGNEQNLVEMLFDAVEESIKNSDSNTINGILNAPDFLENGLAQLSGKVMETVTVIRQAITQGISDSANKIKDYKEEMIGSIKESAGKGAEELKKTINEKVDGIFGASGDTGNGSTGMASFFSFAYSDYLRLFTLIGLYTNQEGILLRTADVIQANMIHLGNKEFRMINAAAYVKITAEIQVKPNLLALPLFADVAPSPVDDTSWYEFTYTGIAGY